MPISNRTTEACDVLCIDLEVARACFKLGDYADAESIVERLLASDLAAEPARLDAFILKACVLSETGRCVDALGLLVDAGDLVDNSPADIKSRFYAQRAHVHVKLGSIDNALVDYEAARFWARESGDAGIEAGIRNNLAKRYSDANQLDKAISESDAAIKMAKLLGDDVLLGRFYDQRARILADHKRIAESLGFSEKAISILGAHPTIAEARETHGKTLLACAVEYLEHADPIIRFRVLRSMSVSLDREIVELALERSKGNVSKAAELLGVYHTGLLKAIRKHGLLDLQQRKHDRKFRKSLITK